MARLFAWAANILLDSANSVVLYRAVFKLSQYIRFSSSSIIFSLFTDWSSTNLWCCRRVLLLLNPL